MTSSIPTVMETFGKNSGLENPQPSCLRDIECKDGDLLFSKMQTLVLPVNLDGKLGDDLGARFRRKYPLMHQKYRSLCEQKLLRPGLLWIFRAKVHVILVFPMAAGNQENVELGMKKFLSTYKDKGIESIAFPLLCGKEADKEDKQRVKNLMESYLSACDIPVEIYTDDVPQSSKLIPLVERLCGCLTEEKKSELRKKICFEQD